MWLVSSLLTSLAAVGIFLIPSSLSLFLCLDFSPGSSDRMLFTSTSLLISGKRHIHSTQKGIPHHPLKHAFDSWSLVGHLFGEVLRPVRGRVFEEVCYPLVVFEGLKLCLTSLSFHAYYIGMKNVIIQVYVPATMPCVQPTVNCTTLEPPINPWLW